MRILARLISIIFFSYNLILLQEYQEVCGTPEPTEEEVNDSRRLVDDYWDLNGLDGRDNDPVHILVAWHVIYSSSGQGNISDLAIEQAVNNLNGAYNETFNYYFTLDTVTRTMSDEWFEVSSDSAAVYSSQELGMRDSLSIDPVHHYNIYSVKTLPVGGWITLGWNYFPMWNIESSIWQGTTIHYQYINSGTLPHEAGHYVGLFHTFQGGCSGANDAVDDTPAMSEDAIYSCDQNQDSCPNDPGNDPVTNFMNYSDCQNVFTDGQAERAYAIIENYHPGLLENEFYYPTLSLSGVNFTNDTDGDGVFNPGETLRVKPSIINYVGVTADDVQLVLSTDDDRLAITDSIIQFQSSIEPGEEVFSTTDWFEVYASTDAQLGNILCNIYITSGSEQYPYEIDFDISVSLSLNQYGFPIEGVSIKSSPLIADLDNNSLGEIYFGSEDDNMYGYMMAGIPLSGFPFEAGDKIQSSPAAGDVDGDGNNEIVFGSYDGKLYILGTNGIQELAYLVSGFIIGAPALGDLDGDNDLEIVFTTQNGTSGKLYAIHHTGEDMDGFPLDLDEKMVVGAAIGDLEGDGLLDIVVTTYENNIYAINSDGSIKSGFPYVASHRFRSPATLVDLDGDNDLEIVAGNDNGNLYILHHDGTVMTTYDVGDDIRGGISVADINDDGSNELLFVGYDDKIHIWNPTTESELDGWPYDMGTNALSCPVTADLDNDGDLEIVTATKSGTIYIFHHDGSIYNNFPYTVAGNIETTPAIGKLDTDDDFEIVFGTTLGLEVIDIKSESGERDSWKLHRGNMMRTGLYNTTLTSVQPKDQIVPAKFFVSQNYPNPFNPSTTIEIQLAETNNLIVSIFDVTGRLINTLVNNKLEAGLYSVEWNGKDQNGRLLPTGVYIMKVVSGQNSHNQKIAFIK